MSDRALSQATARAAAMRHSVGGILRFPVFQSLLRRRSPLERMPGGGHGLSQCRRCVRTGWSKKILRFCGATADHCVVAHCGFTAMESEVKSSVGPSVMSKPMLPTICVSD